MAFSQKGGSSGCLGDQVFDAGSQAFVEGSLAEPFYRVNLDLLVVVRPGRDKLTWQLTTC